MFDDEKRSEKLKGRIRFGRFQIIYRWALKNIPEREDFYSIVKPVLVWRHYLGSKGCKKSWKTECIVSTMHEERNQLCIKREIIL